MVSVVHIHTCMSINSIVYYTSMYAGISLTMYIPMFITYVSDHIRLTLYSDVFI